MTRVALLLQMSCVARALLTQPRLEGCCCCLLIRECVRLASKLRLMMGLAGAWDDHLVETQSEKDKTGTSDPPGSAVHSMERGQTARMYIP